MLPSRSFLPWSKENRILGMHCPGVDFRIPKNLRHIHCHIEVLDRHRAPRRTLLDYKLILVWRVNLFQGHEGRRDSRDVVVHGAVVDFRLRRLEEAYGTAIGELEKNCN